jgi:dihydrofolate reductase
MQITVDGFVAGPEGQLDWMTFDMDEKLLAFINQLTDASDTILLGRGMTEGFVSYWEGVPPTSPEHPFARKMVDTPKIVFSRTPAKVRGRNVRVESGDLVTAVKKLKAADGKDMIVYGGARFVSALIAGDLLDEMHFFVNPIAIGNGLRVFEHRTPLKLTASVAYASGIVVNSYRRR